MVASGADIPEELFERILLHVVRNDKLGSLDVEARRTLSACGLVCRYFADVCRPKLFLAITLQSFDDTQQLCQFLDNPPTSVLPIADHIRWIGAEPEWKDRPWLHLVHLHIIPKLTQPDTEFWVDGSGLVGSSPSRLTSLHPKLPRAPPCWSSDISELHLTDVHFQSSTNLLQLVGSIAWLERLYLSDVTCETFLDVTPPPHGNHLISVNITRSSGDDWLPYFLSLLAETVESTSDGESSLRRPSLEPTELLGLLDVLRPLYATLPAELCNEYPDREWQLSREREGRISHNHRRRCCGCMVVRI